MPDVDPHCTRTGRALLGLGNSCMPSAGGAAGELCTCIHGCVQCANGSVRKKSTEFLTIGFAVYTTNFAFDLLVRVVPPATAAGGPFSATIAVGNGKRGEKCPF
jgi:hypothetical protein